MDAPTSSVKPDFGPTLPDLLQRRLGLGRPRLVLGVAAAALLVVAGAVYLLTRGDDDVSVIHRGAPVFNFRHAKVLAPVAPDAGGLLKISSSRGSVFLQSFAVRPLHLPRYRGQTSGLLPLYATRYSEALARKYRGFDALAEGKARVNGIPGYTVAFKAKLGSRNLYGRDYLLVPANPLGAREGVILTLLQTPAAGANNADLVGTVGALKKPLRSFRFGTGTSGVG